MTKQRYPFLWIVYGLALLGSASAATPIAPFSAEYSVYGNGMPLGSGTIELRTSAVDRYQMTLSIAPNAFASLFAPALDEQAEGRLTADGPQPHHYRGERGTKRRPRTTELSFDWSHYRVDARYNKDQKTLPLPVRAVDPLSLYLQVMWDLQQGRPRDRYTLVDRTRIREYHITAQGEERLTTPFRPLTAQRFERTRPGSSRSVTFWFAPELDYLPVQIILRKSGSEQLRLALKTLRH